MFVFGADHGVRSRGPRLRFASHCYRCARYPAVAATAWNPRCRALPTLHSILLSSAVRRFHSVPGFLASGPSAVVAGGVAGAWEGCFRDVDGVRESAGHHWRSGLRRLPGGRAAAVFRRGSRVGWRRSPRAQDFPTLWLTFRMTAERGTSFRVLPDFQLRRPVDDLAARLGLCNLSPSTGGKIECSVGKSCRERDVVEAGAVCGAGQAGVLAEDAISLAVVHVFKRAFLLHHFSIPGLLGRCSCAVSGIRSTTRRSR